MSHLSLSNILDLSFHDAEELEAVASCVQEFHLVPLNARPLQLDILQLKLDQAIFEFRYLNNPLRVWGAKRTDFLVLEFILSPILGNYLSHGFALDEDTLYGFDNNRGIDLVLPAGLLMGTLIIKGEVFEDCRQIMDRCDLDDRFFANNYIQSPATFAPVQSYLRELYGLVKRREAFLQQSQISKLLLEDYLPLLIEAIPLTRGQTQKPDRFLRRSQLVRQAEDYMLAHLEQPITLKDLCKILNTSKSPLNYGFQEVFGLSPMAYLKVLRLHAAHKVLKSAASPTTKIADIAHRFGFWHAGRFGQDYKQMFGELPSETIKQ